MHEPHVQKSHTAGEVRWGIYLVLLLVVGLGAGCAKSAPLPVIPSQPRRYPITLGLHVPEQVRDAVHQGSVLFTSYTINVGQDSLTLLTAGLRRLFHDVVIVPDNTSPTAASGMRLSMEPFLVRFEVDTPLIGVGASRATITFGAKFYNAQKQVIFETSGTWTGVSRRRGKKGPQAATRIALRSATAHILEAIAASDTIRALASTSPGLTVYEAGKTLYFKARFSEAITTLQRAITLLRSDAPGVHRDHILCDAYVLAGASLVATGAEERARAAFHQAVQLRPELTLDQAVYAPKIRRLFHSAKTGE